MKLVRKEPSQAMDQELQALFQRLSDDLQQVFSHHGVEGETLKTVALTISTTEGGFSSVGGCTCPACKVKLVQMFARQLARCDEGATEVMVH